jgi:hypothetical protein
MLHHSNFGSFMHLLGHVREEPESEVQAEQAQAEAPTYLALDQCYLPLCSIFIVH